MYAGMHKKSIEASQKLKEEEERSGSTGEGDEVGLSRLIPDIDTTAPSSLHRPQTTDGQTDRRTTESIALLRAKAQCYSARMLQGLPVTSQHDQPHDVVSDFSTCSRFQSPSIALLSTGC